MPKNTPLIGSDRAAKMYGVDRATFNRWVKQGRIPIALEMEGITGARLFDADQIDVLAADYRAKNAKASGNVA